MVVSQLKIALLALLLATGGAVWAEQGVAASADAPAPVTDWRQAAREDIEAAYQIFSQHHPGMFDPGNPGFPNQLKRARDTALAFAEHIDDAEGHMRALEAFSAVLADGHAGVFASYSGAWPPLWPGFTTQWRGDFLLVDDPGEAGPPRGSALLACDGQDARELIRKIFLYARPDEQGQWWDQAPIFFLRGRSPYETLPQDCSFAGPDGRTTAYHLNWQPLPDAAWDKMMAEAQREPIGLSEPRNRIELITLSTFNPDEEGIAQYERLSQALDADVATLAKARAIVLDLRRNNGGSDFWPERVAGSLWGEAAFDAAMADYFRNTETRLLADEANIAHFRKFAAQWRRQGRAEDADTLDEIADNLELAHKRGDRFYSEAVGPSYASDANSPPPRRLPPVYVIVSGDCVSACLDAVDMFTRFPGVKLIGAPTSADSAYLDIRQEILPSGRGFMTIPTRIWVNRPRAPGQIYLPDIAVNDLDWSTATMLDHIERDLAR